MNSSQIKQKLAQLKADLAAKEKKLELKSRLHSLKKEFQKSQRKLERADRAAKVRAHVKSRLADLREAASNSDDTISGEVVSQGEAGSCAEQNAPRAEADTSGGNDHGDSKVLSELSENVCTPSEKTAVRNEACSLSLVSSVDSHSPKHHNGLVRVPRKHQNRKISVFSDALEGDTERKPSRLPSGVPVDVNYCQTENHPIIGTDYPKQPDTKHSQYNPIKRKVSRPGKRLSLRQESRDKVASLPQNAIEGGTSQPEPNIVKKETFQEASLRLSTNQESKNVVELYDSIHEMSSRESESNPVLPSPVTDFGMSPDIKASNHEQRSWKTDRSHPSLEVGLSPEARSPSAADTGRSVGIASVSQALPECAAGVSHAASTCAAGVSQVAPKCTAIMTHTTSKCAASVSQMVPKCEASMSQVVSKCTASVSQTVPKPTASVSQTVTKPTASGSQQTSKCVAINSWLMSERTSSNSKIIVACTARDSQLMSGCSTSDSKITSKCTTSESKIMSNCTAVDSQLMPESTASDIKIVQGCTANDSQLMSECTANDSRLMSECTANDSQLMSECTANDSQLMSECTANDSQLMSECTANDSQLMSECTANDSQLMSECTANDSQLMSECTAIDSQLMSECKANDSQLMSECTANDSQLMSECTANDSQLMSECTANDSQLMSECTASDSQLISECTADDSQLMSECKANDSQLVSKPSQPSRKRRSSKPRSKWTYSLPPRKSARIASSALDGSFLQAFSQDSQVSKADNTSPMLMPRWHEGLSQATPAQRRRRSRKLFPSLPKLVIEQHCFDINFVEFSLPIDDFKAFLPHEFGQNDQKSLLGQEQNGSSQDSSEKHDLIFTRKTSSSLLRSVGEISKLPFQEFFLPVDDFKDFLPKTLIPSSPIGNSQINEHSLLDGDTYSQILQENMASCGQPSPATCTTDSLADFTTSAEPNSTVIKEAGPKTFVPKQPFTCLHEEHNPGSCQNDFPGAASSTTSDRGVETTHNTNTLLLPHTPVFEVTNKQEEAVSFDREAKFTDGVLVQAKLVSVHKSSGGTLLQGMGRDLESLNCSGVLLLERSSAIKGDSCAPLLERSSVIRGDSCAPLLERSPAIKGDSCAPRLDRSPVIKDDSCAPILDRSPVIKGDSCAPILDRSSQVSAQVKDDSSCMVFDRAAQKKDDSNGVLLDTSRIEDHSGGPLLERYAKIKDGSNGMLLDTSQIGYHSGGPLLEGSAKIKDGSNGMLLDTSQIEYHSGGPLLEGSAKIKDGSNGMLLDTSRIEDHSGGPLLERSAKIKDGSNGMLLDTSQIEYHSGGPLLERSAKIQDGSNGMLLDTSQIEYHYGRPLLEGSAKIKDGSNGMLLDTYRIEDHSGGPLLERSAQVKDSSNGTLLDTSPFEDHSGGPLLEKSAQVKDGSAETSLLNSDTVVKHDVLSQGKLLKLKDNPNDILSQKGETDVKDSPGLVETVTEVVNAPAGVLLQGKADEAKDSHVGAALPPKLLTSGDNASGIQEEFAGVVKHIESEAASQPSVIQETQEEFDGDSDLNASPETKLSRTSTLDTEEYKDMDVATAEWKVSSRFLVEDGQVESLLPGKIQGKDCRSNYVVVVSSTEVSVWLQRTASWDNIQTWSIRKTDIDAEGFTVLREERVCFVVILHNQTDQSCEAGLYSCLEDGSAANYSPVKSTDGRLTRGLSGCDLGFGNFALGSFLLDADQSQIWKYGPPDRDGGGGGESPLEFVPGRVLSLSPLESREAALIGYCQDFRLYIWNHEIGLLLTTISLPTVLDSPSMSTKMITVTEKNGLLYVVLKREGDSKQRGCVVTVNPNTRSSKVRHTFDIKNSADTHRARCKHSGSHVQNGTLRSWDNKCIMACNVLSGELEGWARTPETAVCLSPWDQGFYMAEEAGWVHMITTQ